MILVTNSNCPLCKGTGLVKEIDGIKRVCPLCMTQFETPLYDRWKESIAKVFGIPIMVSTFAHQPVIMDKKKVEEALNTLRLGRRYGKTDLNMRALRLKIEIATYLRKSPENWTKADMDEVKMVYNERAYFGSAMEDDANGN